MRSLASLVSAVQGATAATTRPAPEKATLPTIAWRQRVADERDATIGNSISDGIREGNRDPTFYLIALPLPSPGNIKPACLRRANHLSPATPIVGHTRAEHGRRDRVPLNTISRKFISFFILFIKIYLIKIKTISILDKL
ncbi:hypothetical protein MANES_15G183310v8 [Manihot esculenta]|uniref:Uncharacterized protein n=1 Tax=Manihot esculenta TaxID=3983 RepID=A0ACB7GHB7_MANES|nr:hypothetical protein MANES_15G183310v8 [Manihot esculenta]